MEVWIVIDYEDSSGPESLKGVFSNEYAAKLYLADYVLKNTCNSEWLAIVKKKVYGGTKE